jgi:hypothetical protein
MDCSPKRNGAVAVAVAVPAALAVLIAMVFLIR